MKFSSIFLSLLIGLFAFASPTAYADGPNPSPSSIPITSPDFQPSPGNMAPYAFSDWLWHVNDAHINGNVIDWNLGIRDTLDERGQWAQAATLHLTIPFSDLASVEFRYLVENWKLNAAGMAYYQPVDTHAITPGDVIAIVKFNVLKEARNHAELTLSGSIKTAPGDFERDHRFTDSSGYEIGAEFSKFLMKTQSLSLRLMGEINFMCWDTQQHGQDDTAHWGLAVQLKAPKKRLTATVGAYGTYGWINDGDRPVTLYAELEYAITHNLSGSVSVDHAVCDGSKITEVVGLKLGMPRFYGKTRSLIPPS